MGACKAGGEGVWDVAGTWVGAGDDEAEGFEGVGGLLGVLVQRGNCGGQEQEHRCCREVEEGRRGRRESGDGSTVGRSGEEGVICEESGEAGRGIESDRP